MKKYQILDDSLRHFAHFLCQKHAPSAGTPGARWTATALDAHLDNLRRSLAAQNSPPGPPPEPPVRDARVQLQAVSGLERLKAADQEVADIMMKFSDVKSHSEFLLSQLGDKRCFAADELHRLQTYVLVNCFVSFAVSSSIGINQRHLHKLFAALGKLASRPADGSGPAVSSQTVSTLLASLQLLSKVGPRDWLQGLSPADVDVVALASSAVLSEHLAELRASSKNSYVQKYHLVDAFVQGRSLSPERDERLAYKTIRYTVEAFYLAVEAFCELIYVNYQPQEYSYKTILINRPKDASADKKLLIYLYECNDRYRLFCSYEPPVPRPPEAPESLGLPERTDRPSTTGHSRNIYRALTDKPCADAPEDASPSPTTPKLAQATINVNAAPQQQPPVSAGVQLAGESTSPTRDTRLKLTAARPSVEQYQVFDKQAVLGSLVQLLEEFDSSTEKLALLRKKPYRDEAFARGRSFSREATAVIQHVKVVRVAGRSQDVAPHSRQQPKPMPSAVAGVYGRSGQPFKTDNFRPLDLRYSSKQPSSSYRYMNYSDNNDFGRELPANNLYTHNLH